MPAKGQAKISPKMITERANLYFQKCDNSRIEYVTKAGVPGIRQIPYTMIGLANSIGISRRVLYAWLEGKYPSDGSPKGEKARLQVQRTLMCMRDKIEQYTVEHAALGDIDNRIAQLIMSGWGYKDKQEIEHKGGISVTWQGVSGKDAEAWSK